MVPFPDKLAAEIMLVLMPESKTTGQIHEELGTVAIETVRYMVTAMQLLGLVRSIAIVEGPPRDVVWTLSEHAMSHNEQRLGCRACELRERMLWGGPVLE